MASDWERKSFQRRRFAKQRMSFAIGTKAAGSHGAVKGKLLPNCVHLRWIKSIGFKTESCYFFCVCVCVCSSVQLETADIQYRFWSQCRKSGMRVDWSGRLTWKAEFRIEIAAERTTKGREKKLTRKVKWNVHSSRNDVVESMAKRKNSFKL